MKENVQFSLTLKDDLALKQRIPCECGKVYIRETGHSVECVIKAHHQHIWFYHLEKSPVVEHIINPGHCVLLKDTSKEHKPQLVANNAWLAGAG
jgi:hypothetical protein